MILGKSPEYHSLIPVLDLLQLFSLFYGEIPTDLREIPQIPGCLKQGLKAVGDWNRLHERLRESYVALIASLLDSPLVRNITKHVEGGYKWLGLPDNFLHPQSLLYQLQSSNNK